MLVCDQTTSVLMPLYQFAVVVSQLPLPAVPPPFCAWPGSQVQFAARLTGQSPDSKAILIIKARAKIVMRRIGTFINEIMRLIIC